MVVNVCVLRLNLAKKKTKTTTTKKNNDGKLVMYQHHTVLMKNRMYATLTLISKISRLY